jgi:predicted pyridoxine 5'-phosphate oxidase superfamily flavin-nucleotide-binding protein
MLILHHGGGKRLAARNLKFNDTPECAGDRDILTPDMKRVIEEQRLGFVATVSPDGSPNVAPKGTFVVLDDRTIAFGEIRSPGTIRNLKANPRIEVNFVDVFERKGYRFAGIATVVERGQADFEMLLPTLRSALAHRIRAIVTISVTRALPLTSPAYDDGKTELELRRAWTTRFRLLQPRERFEE